MASSTGWKLLAAIGALMLATNACGDDTSKQEGNGDGDSGDGDKGDGDGDGVAPAKPLLEPNVAGNACTSDGECGATGRCAKELTGGMLPSLLGGILPGDGIDISMATPGNYCTAVCKSDADCNTGGACFGILPSSITSLLGSGGGGLTGAISGECRKQCTANTDCREGYECAEINAKGLAAIPMFGTIAGFITPGIPKTCQPVVVPQTIDDTIVGKACTTDEECGAGSCLGYQEPQDGGAATPGACTADCVAGKDELCGANEGLCTGVFYGTGGTCAEKCNTAADCKQPNATCTAPLGVKICTPGEAPAPQPTGDAGTDAG